LQTDRASAFAYVKRHERRLFAEINGLLTPAHRDGGMVEFVKSYHSCSLVTLKNLDAPYHSKSSKSDTDRSGTYQMRQKSNR